MAFDSARFRKSTTGARQRPRRPPVPSSTGPVPPAWAANRSKEADHFLEIRVVREGVDVVSAVAEYSGISIDVTDLGFARDDAFQPCRRCSPWSLSSPRSIVIQMWKTLPRAHDTDSLVDACVGMPMLMVSAVLYSVAKPVRSCAAGRTVAVLVTYACTQPLSLGGKLNSSVSRLTHISDSRRPRVHVHNHAAAALRHPGRETVDGHRRAPIFAGTRQWDNRGTASRPCSPTRRTPPCNREPPATRGSASPAALRGNCESSNRGTADPTSASTERINDLDDFWRAALPRRRIDPGIRHTVMASRYNRHRSPRQGSEPPGPRSLLAVYFFLAGGAGGAAATG